MLILSARHRQETWLSARADLEGAEISTLLMDSDLAEKSAEAAMVLLHKVSSIRQRQKDMRGVCNPFNAGAEEFNFDSSVKAACRKTLFFFEVEDFEMST